MSEEDSLIFDPTSVQPQNVLVKLGKRQSHLLARKNTPVDIRKGDAEACFLTPSILAGRCVGLCGLHAGHVRRIIICVYRSCYMVRGISLTKEMLFQAGVWGAAEFSGVLIGTEIVILFRLHFMPV